jgi:hypothetical protein
MEDNINFVKMEDDLIFFLIQRQPQFFHHQVVDNLNILVNGRIAGNLTTTTTSG